MKTINDIFTWIFQSGAIVWLFYFGFAVAKPWVDNRIKHAKTVQQKEAWSLLEQVAMTTVNSLVSSDKSGAEKLAEATNQVQFYLNAHGIKIDEQTSQSAVQAAYEKSPLTTPKQSNDLTTEQQTLPGMGIQSMEETPKQSSLIPQNTKTLKSVPTSVDELKEIAVQTPNQEAGDTNGTK